MDTVARENGSSGPALSKVIMLHSVTHRTRSGSCCGERRTSIRGPWALMVAWRIFAATLRFGLGATTVMVSP